MLYPQLIILLFVAAFTCWLLTWPARIFSSHINAVALPGGHRRHNQAIPMMGGLCIFTVLFASWYMYGVSLSSYYQDFIPCVLGFLIIGLIDDIYPLGGTLKLLMQLPITVYFAYDVFIPWSNAPLEHAIITWCIIFWVLLITNGINFIDGLDGLCCGLTVLISLTLLAISVDVTENIFLIITVTALAGAALGFLLVNRSPAKIFLGNSGSFLIGFLLSTLSLSAFMPPWNVHYSLLVPMIICFALPIADNLLTVLRRTLLKRPLFRSDWGHIHHRLIDTGMDKNRIVYSLWLIQLFYCILSFVSFRFSSLLSLCAATAIMVSLLLYRNLKHKERVAGINTYPF